MSESLLKVIKEANKEIRENSDKFDTDKKILDHYTPFYERIKDKVETYNVFQSVCLCDFNFNFAVGDANDIKEVENTTIKRNPDVESVDNGVKPLSKFSKEQKEYLQKAKEVQPILSVKPNKEFDNFGLRHSIEHLNTIGGSIVFLPLEDMAEYVDVVTKAFTDADDKFWIISQYNNLIESYSDEALNNFGSTSLGNFAYVAMYCKHKPSAEIALIILNKFYDMVMVEVLKMNDRTNGGKHILN